MRKNADEALNRDVHCAEAHIASAGCAQQERKYGVVARELATAVELRPNDAGIRLAVAQTQEQVGWEKEASENYERAYRLSPLEPNIVFKYGHMLYESGKAAKAIQYLDDALRLKPKSVLFRVTSAAADFSWRGDTAQANNILARLPPEEDAEGRATSAHCTLALLKRDFEEALTKLQEYKAPTLATVDSWGLGGQDSTVEAEGTIRLYKGEFARARECFQEELGKYEKAVSEDPESAVDLVQRALIYAWIGRKEAALADAKSARDREQYVPPAGPIRRGYILGLAKVYVWAGDPDRALEQIARFVKLPPSGYSYHNFRLDPAWDSLRNTPGFQQQLEIMKRRSKKID
jgi:tetratricopeptide (TPR) repeat protein